MSIENSVLLAGTPTPFHEERHLYDAQVGDAEELVRGRVLSRGTTGPQYLRLYAAGTQPLAIGNIQKSRTLIRDGIPDHRYARDGSFIDSIPIEDTLIVRLEMKANETIEQDDLVYGEDTTGLATGVPGVGDIPVGWAVEEVTTPLGETGEITVRLFKTMDAAV